MNGIGFSTNCAAPDGRGCWPCFIQFQFPEIRLGRAEGQRMVLAVRRVLGIPANLLEINMLNMLFHKVVHFRAVLITQQCIPGQFRNSRHQQGKIQMFIQHHLVALPVHRQQFILHPNQGLPSHNLAAVRTVLPLLAEGTGGTDFGSPTKQRASVCMFVRHCGIYFCTSAAF